MGQGSWYPRVPDPLGVPWEHRTLSPRSPIEQWLGILKHRIKRPYKRWPHNADLQRVDDGPGSLVACHHLRRGSI